MSSSSFRIFTVVLFGLHHRWFTIIIVKVFRAATLYNTFNEILLAITRNKRFSFQSLYIRLPNETANKLNQLNCVFSFLLDHFDFFFFTALSLNYSGTESSAPPIINSLNPPPPCVSAIIINFFMCPGKP